MTTGQPSGELVFDEAMSRRVEAIYTTRDVLRRRRLVREALAVAPGERVLDVGCGPGFYVAELLDSVGADGGVLGVDNSVQMLALAADRCAGRPNAEFRQAEATELPVPDASVDAALCVQVLEYVADATAALIEMRRTLRPGGRVVVWDVDWSTVSWHSGDPERMRRVLRAFDAHLAHPSLPRTLASRLRAAGFGDVRAEGHTFASIELIADAYIGAVMPLIESFVLGRDGLPDADVRDWAAEQRELHERGEFFFGCIQFCFTATRR